MTDYPRCVAPPSERVSQRIVGKKAHARRASPPYRKVRQPGDQARLDPGDRPGEHRTAAPSLPLLIAVAALGAAAMNLILPLLPTLQIEFGGDYRRVQSTLTAFLLGAALAQLTMGPLSDTYGRRPVLLGTLGLFCAGAAMSALAPSLYLLDAGRFLQGFGGAAGLVLAQAIVLDTSAKAGAAHRIGCLSAGMAVAIMVAPAVGAVIGAGLGWRALFWIALGIGVLLAAICRSRIAKTAAAPAARAMAEAGSGAFRLLASRRFVGHALCAGFVQANYFCLAAFGPLIAISLLGLSRIEYGLLFGALGIGFIGGSLISARLHQRYGQTRVTVATLLLGALAGGTGAALLGLGWLGPASFFAIGCIISLVTGVVFPGATSGALGASRESAGAGAGLLNFAIYGIGALVTAIVGAHLGPSAIAAMAALPVATVAALLANLWALRAPARP